MGIVDGEVLLDLAYEEDSRADVDMNFVMMAGGKMVEVQATAEHQVFDDQQLAKMISLRQARRAGIDRETEGTAEGADGPDLARTMRRQCLRLSNLSATVNLFYCATQPRTNASRGYTISQFRISCRGGRIRPPRGAKRRVTRPVWQRSKSEIFAVLCLRFPAS